ncbi:hypothetical protein pb186bvf_012902 [Paramecium bursaria]
MNKCIIQTEFQLKFIYIDKMFLYYNIRIINKFIQMSIQQYEGKVIIVIMDLTNKIISILCLIKQIQSSKLEYILFYNKCKNPLFFKRASMYTKKFQFELDKDNLRISLINILEFNSINSYIWKNIKSIQFYMWNYAILKLVFLQIMFFSALSQCQSKTDGGPTLLYPTLGSPLILDLNKYFDGSNLKFSFQGAQAAILFQTIIGPESQIQLNGQVISSCQQQNNLYPNDPKSGQFAFLTKNSSGFYVYQLEITDTTLQVEQVGDAIQVPFYINCFSLAYQQQGLFVSCLASNNQPIIYWYNLANNPSLTILYPFPQFVNFTLSVQNIQDNYLIQYNYNTVVLGYSSTANNQSMVLYLNLTNNYQPMNSSLYNSQLNGVWAQEQIGIELLLFPNLLLIQQYPNYTYNYTYPGLQFLDFSVSYQFNLFVTIATQQSILLLQYDLQINIINFVDQLPYPQNFNATVDSDMQLFTDDQFIIISNGLQVIVYEIINPQQIFWNYSIGGQYNLQYDTQNQILIIMMQDGIYSYQLFTPKLILQFNTLVQGQLLLYGNSQQTCSTQLNYSVILSNNTLPLPNYQNQNYTLNYPNQQIQGLSSLFVGQNLSYIVASSNSNIQIVFIDRADFMSGQKFNYINAFYNPYNNDQYMIIYQLQNQNPLQLIFCTLQYCKQTIQTPIFPGFINLNSQVLSLSVGANLFDLTSNQLYKQRIEIVIIVNSSIINPTYYNCIFEWFSPFTQCEIIERFTYIAPPTAYITQVVFNGLNFYAVLNNPNFMAILTGQYVYQQFQTRQIFTNVQDYKDILFLDNINELSVQQALILDQLTQLTAIQYPIQQGNTSVGVGLLRQGIFIVQIDNQGNQFILYYDNIILIQTNFISTIQPQQIQIPTGIKIQFPIISTFTSNKFYVVWNYEGQNQIAVLQPSSDINSILYQSIYVSQNIGSLNAISIGDYDQVFCLSTTGLVTSYFIINKFYVEIIPQNLLQKTKIEIQLNITASNTYSNETQSLNYTVNNQIFDIITTNNYQPSFNITLENTNSFKFNPQTYYNGLVNSYQGINNNNELNNIQGPISLLNGVIKLSPKPQSFYATDQDVLFQNNQNLYRLDNIQIGSYKVIAQFSGMSTCPMLSIYDQIAFSICQDSKNYTFQYTFNLNSSQQSQDFLNNGYGQLLSGEYLGQNIFFLNYGTQIVFQANNQQYCTYQNANIDGSKQIVAVYNQQQFISAVQLQNSSDILIVKNCIAVSIIRLGPLINGKISSFQLTTTSNNTSQYMLIILTNQVGIIYYFNIENNILDIISYQMINDIKMNGISCQFIQDNLISIYEYEPSNYTIIVYALSQNTQILQSKLPVIAFSSLFQQGISNFYFTQQGQIFFVVDNGFSYLQFTPDIYVGINNDLLKSTLIYTNNTYQIMNTQIDLVIRNPFYGISVGLNLTLTNYQGEYIALKSYASTNQFLSLLLISLFSLIGFFIFVCVKIFRKQIFSYKELIIELLKDID